MKKDELESAVLDLWVTTRIPLTMANLQHYTGQPRKKLEKRLDELVIDGRLEMDSDDEGEIFYTVLGAQRPGTGATDFGAHDKLAALKASVEAEFAQKKARREQAEAEARARRERELAELEAMGGLEDLDGDGDRHSNDSRSDDGPSMLDRLRGKVDAGTALSIATSARSELDKPPGEGKKSILASGGLSLAFGPLGWLYAGAYREAIPAGLAFALVAYILPTFLLLPIMGVAMPLSGLAGLVYAWQYNQKGKRGTLFGSDDKKDE